jgi:hypothetical protein
MPRLEKQVRVYRIPDGRSLTLRCGVRQLRRFVGISGRVPGVDSGVAGNRLWLRYGATLGFDGRPDSWLANPTDEHRGDNLTGRRTRDQVFILSPSARRASRAT